MRLLNEKLLRNLLIALAALVVIINAIIAGTSSSALCATCHRAEKAALKNSSHSTIRCNACHQRNDVFDVIAWRAKVVGMVIRQASFSYSKPVIADVASKNCIRCHENITVSVVRRNAIKVSHKEINDAGHKCTGCHNTVAHPGATTNEKFPTMDKCTSCHSGQRVGASCELCHMKEVNKRKRVQTSWSMTHGPEWKRLHGMGDLHSCKVCHGAEYCLKCHNASLPHPEFWVKLHSRDSKTKVEGCYQCHHKTYCLNCHGTVMPHDGDFLKSHGRQVNEKGKELCERCHLESGCNRCHTQHTHPGLDQERMRELRRGAGLD